MSQDITIALQVVTALAGEGAGTCIAPQFQRGNNCAKRCLWCLGVGCVMGDIRMRCIQPARGGNIVSAFSDGERDYG